MHSLAKNVLSQAEAPQDLMTYLPAIRAAPLRQVQRCLHTCASVSCASRQVSLLTLSLQDSFKIHLTSVTLPPSQGGLHDFFPCFSTLDTETPE